MSHDLRRHPAVRPSPHLFGFTEADVDRYLASPPSAWGDLLASGVGLALVAAWGWAAWTLMQHVQGLAIVFVFCGACLGVILGMPCFMWFVVPRIAAWDRTTAQWRAFTAIWREASLARIGSPPSGSRGTCSS